MLKHFCLAICFACLSLSAHGKVLDIIVGGSIGSGLQCKTDSNCADGSYCNQEQYYCVACKVPPYEWTGTECRCPEGTVEKDSETCVECLFDTHCESDYYCNTNTNLCTYCKFPKLWFGNTCVCPAGTREQAGACICIQENTELDDETGRCICILNENKCGNVNFNEEECVCCPSNKPLYMAQSCRSCASVYSDRTIWDNTLKECVQCQTNTDCNGTTPVCELSAHVCESCPTDYPDWDASNGQCVRHATVTWRSADTTNTQTVKSNEDVSSKNPDNIEGYNFDGWYRDAALTDRAEFPVRIGDDITFYAKWVGTSTESAEIPINKCGGSRLGSEYTYTKGEYRVPKNAVVQLYARSAWNNDGYNCSGKQGNYYVNWLTDDGTHVSGPQTFTNMQQCSWIDLGNAPANVIRVQTNDWSKYCDVVFRIKIKYQMPDITY